MRFAHRVEPVRRLVVVERVLGGDGARPCGDRRLVVLLRARDPRVEYRVGDSEDRAGGVVVERRVGRYRAARLDVRGALPFGLGRVAKRGLGDASAEVPQCGENLVLRIGSWEGE